MREFGVIKNVQNRSLFNKRRDLTNYCNISRRHSQDIFIDFKTMQKKYGPTRIRCSRYIDDNNEEHNKD